MLLNGNKHTQQMSRNCEDLKDDYGEARRLHNDKFRFFYTHMKSNNKYQTLAHPLGIIAW